MDIEIHGSVKEVGVSRPEEFGRKIVNFKDCNYIKIYPRGREHTEDFLEIEITATLRKHRLKKNRVKSIYRLRGSRPFNVRPEVANSIWLETILFEE